MLSWLNFEELLIHNPIQLINPSESVISVAMNKKQYIEFFSNKYTYNGLYYDEAMDFCLFYYADPLQSSKNGDMYAEGYIDVDMKIYRVKWLCNVSISRPFAPKIVNLLDVPEDVLSLGTGENRPSQWTRYFNFKQNKTVANLFKVGDTITVSFELEFFNTELYDDSDDRQVRLQIYQGDWHWLCAVNAKNVNGKFYTRETFKTGEFTENSSHKIKISQTTEINQNFIDKNSNVNATHFVYDNIPNGASVSVSNLKLILNSSEQKHTAYAYSSDGKDRFSTIYPRFNLGENTKNFNNTRSSIGIISGVEKTLDGDVYSLTYKATMDNSDWFRFFLIPYSEADNIPRVEVKPNTEYTFSVWLKGTGTHRIYAYNGWTEPWNAWLDVNLTSDWKLYTFTVTTRNVVPTENVQFFIRSNAGAVISLKKPKVEEGSTATPYMQSQSEVTDSDYPSYIGTYTDYTTEDSPYPESYTWSKIQNKWNVTKTGMVVNTTNKTITMVQAGALMKCGVDNNISGWTDGTTQLDLSGDDFLIDGYGMRGLHNG